MADRRESDAAGLRVRDIESQLPRSSFGSIERYVEVSAAGDRRFEPGTIRIEYSPEHLGWVDPETLRVFRLDIEERRWELVGDSGPEGRGAVRARVHQPGIYGVVGLPRHSAVLEAVRRICAVPSGVMAGERLSPVLPTICSQILCAPGADRWSGADGPPLPPGGFGDSVCDFCTGLHTPAGGLPECELLRAPERPAAETSTEAARVYAVTALAWTGIIIPYGGVAFPSWIEVFDLNPPTPTASFDIGDRWCTSLAVSSSADRLYVADVSGREVAAYDDAGALVGSVPLPPQPGGWILDCALSPDDATLYVAVSHALVVIDTASLSVTSVVSTDDELVGMAMSADGVTVAAAGAMELHLLDTATLAHISLGWPGRVRPIDVGFAAPSRVLAWDDQSGVLVDINLVSGVMSSIATFPAGPSTYASTRNNSFLYAPGSDSAYAVRDIWNPVTGSLASEIVTIHIPAGTCSTRQFSAWVTVPALTPTERLLVAESRHTPNWSDFLELYDPSTQQLSAELCAVPHPNVRDMKVVRS
ncbi:MAG: YncE family protein [Solirubrobacteraceae bacterium]